MLSEFQQGDRVVEIATGLEWVVVEEYEEGDILCERHNGHRIIGCYFWPEMLLRR